MFTAGAVESIQVQASNTYAAYEKAFYEVIPEKEGSLPYSAWVSSVMYNNGNAKLFNNFEGKPY
jgi:hypothetical protein